MIKPRLAQIIHEDCRESRAPFTDDKNLATLVASIPASQRVRVATQILITEARRRGEQRCVLAHDARARVITVLHDTEGAFTQTSAQWQQGDTDQIGSVHVSRRQAGVLRRLLFGLAEKEIAREEGISRHTVHEHVKALYRKFDVTTRAELLSKLLRAGVTKVNELVA